jgi:hypothetical protein
MKKETAPRKNKLEKDEVQKMYSGFGQGGMKKILKVFHLFRLD